MDRRTFLKCVAAVAAYSATPKAVFDAMPKKMTESRTGVNGDFGKLKWEKGNAIPLGKNPTKKEITEIVQKILLPDAKRTLGSGIVCEIRMMVPQNFGRDRGIAWYTNNIIVKQSPQRIVRPIINERSGYIYCGRVKT